MDFPPRYSGYCAPAPAPWFWLVGFGMAHRSRLGIEVGTWGMIFCFVAGFVCNVYGSFRWPQLALPRTRHWVAPLIWLVGPPLLLYFAMELGTRI